MKLSPLTKTSSNLEKYSGAGNTFLITRSLQPNYTTLCNTYQVDGVIVALPSIIADIRMRIFNLDGSEAQMCGNGLRCLVQYLYDHGHPSPQCAVESAAGLHNAWLERGEICTEMTPPHSLESPCPPPLDGHFINTGVPHFVTFIPSFDTQAIKQLGQQLVSHPHFAPHGTNVNFAIIHDSHTLSLRTYERGVNRETLACGTGATAAAVIATQLGHTAYPVTVTVASGESLLIDRREGQLILRGPAIKL